MEIGVSVDFLEVQDTCPIRVTCKDLGYPQPPTTIMVDKPVTVGSGTGRTKVKQYKVINMNFHWLDHFIVFWIPGKINSSDYVPNLHTLAYYLGVRIKCFTMDHLANRFFSILLKGVEMGLVPQFHIQFPQTRMSKAKFHSCM